MSTGTKPRTTFTTCTGSGSKRQSLAPYSNSQAPLPPICEMWLADSKLTPSLSTSSRQTAPPACSDSIPQTQQLKKPCCLLWTSSCQPRHSWHVRGRTKGSLLLSCAQPSRLQHAARSQARTAWRMSSILISGTCLAQNCWQCFRTPC